MKNRVRMNLVSFLLAAGIIIADRLLKNGIRSMLSPGQSLFSSPVLSVVYVRNSGSAFGLFGGNPFLLIIIGICLLAGLGFYLLKYSGVRGNALTRIAFAMIAGGAAGNLWDRAADGYVTDFLYLSCIHFPVFNLADLFITLGCFLMLGIFMMDSKKEAAALGDTSVHAGGGERKNEDGLLSERSLRHDPLKDCGADQRGKSDPE